MKSMKTLKWPDNFVRRFGLAMAVYQPVLFVTSIVVGWVRQLSIPETMLAVWVWAFVIGLVISLMQAATGKPGESIWKSTVFQ